jgi:hypothetical protein
MSAIKYHVIEVAELIVSYTRNSIEIADAENVVLGDITTDKFQGKE